MVQMGRPEPRLRTVRAAGAVGFIVCRWLLTACNIPAVCWWLSTTSSLAAAVYLGAFLWTPSRPVAAVLGRIGSQVLALTCAVNLAAGLLSVARPMDFSGRAIIVDVLDGVAWIWVLWATLASARWLWPSRPESGAATASLALRHVLSSTLIVLVLGLQVLVFATRTKTWWPFQDYPLYSASHRGPVRAVHYRLYGLTASEPHRFVEISPQALKESFFVYHTQFIPRLFANPSIDLEDFHHRLDNSHLPTFQLLLAQRTTFGLNDSQLVEFPEHQLVWLEPEGLEP